MIHTLTLNTAIDMNIFCDPLQPAAVNRTRQTEYCPNGKGVNVSLVLHHYQQPTHVMGIFGGFTGRYIVEELRKQHINVTPAWVAEPTRINIFINDGSDEYKLVNPGARINDEGKEQILHHLQCVTPGDYLVISGSLPPGIESRFYSEILVLCQQKGCEVILDISHPVLRQLLEWRPLLIKPNDDELKEIFGLDVSNPRRVREAMQTLHQLGARNVLLTLARKDSTFRMASSCGSARPRKSSWSARPALAMPRWARSSANGLTQTIFPRRWRWPAPPAPMLPPPPGLAN